MAELETLKGHITVAGHIDVPANRLDTVTAAMPAHKKKSLAEPGCLHFEIVACREIPGRFLVREHFVDRAAFEAHQSRSAGTRWAQLTEGIGRDYTITEHR